MIKKLFLDLNNFKANLGSVERGDSIELNIKLLDGEDYSRSKFRVLGAKADGKYVEQIECINLEEKDLKIVLEDQFVNCEGIVKLELNVVSDETEITTKEFYFFVSNTMNAEIIDSADSIPTLEKVSKYVDDAVNNLDSLKEASEDITIINSEFKEAEIKRKANELLRERSEKERVRLESIRTTEEAERIKAEAERKEAENNRKVAESNRKLAENTRKTNEAARVEAELNRQSLFEENEEIRNENENLRIEAEKERKLTFSNNNKFESERVEAEKLRCIAEDKRVTAEKARANAEEERIKAETRRENTYTDFNDSEVERKNNEANRVRAEAERVNAESGRNELFNTNEEKRNSTFIESERTRERAFNEAQSNRNEAYEESERVREEAFKVSEAARNEAEEERGAAEVLRVEAEKLRVAGEENRNNTFTQSEEERKTTFEEAENARKVAESKRVKVESFRVEAEKLRVTGETGRVEAESLRVTAEEERAAAETKREEGFNKFDGKINDNTEELKNARSATTGEKFNTLDERIDCEVDRLNKKIDVTMLQQEDKESHDINNTVEGMTTDMTIKGRTLINLIPSLNDINWKIQRDSNAVVDSTSITMRKVDGNTYSDCYTNISTLFKTSTKYTIIIEIENNNNVDYLNCNAYGGNLFSDPKIQLNKKSGVFTILKTTASNFANKNQEIQFQFYGTISSENNASCKIVNLMILEGDWTNKPIPKYFEGIKSFGQQEDKISILSTGKNLLKPPTTDITKKQGNIDITLTKHGEFIVNGNNSTTGGGRHSFINEYNYKVEKGKSYTMTYERDGGTSDDSNSPVLLLTNINNYDEILVSTTTTANKKSVTFEANKDMTLFCGVNVSVGKSYNNYKLKIQLEEGKNATQYEPYKEDKKDILLQDLGFDEGLRGLNNSVYDELNSIKDVAVKRVDKKVLNGDESWLADGGVNQYGFIRFYTSHIPIDTTGAVIDMCDRLPTLPKSDKYDRSGITRSGAGYFEICINAELIGGSQPQNIKNWLNQNPITVYYPLMQHIETPLSENINLKTFGEKTYVSFENSLSGTSSFKAPVDAAATISRLNRENRALEEENKNLRQDFESTTLVLTDSDLELVKQNVDMDFRLMEVEFALDIPQAILSSDIKFKNKKGEVKSMARTPYEMMKIVILSGDYDREDYIHKVGKYYERGRMTKEEHDELMSLMTADEVISK